MAGEQPPLFGDMDRARAAGDDGLERAVRHAGDAWLMLAIEAVRTACLTRETLICDDVWATGLESGASDRAFGQAMKEGVRRGWMAPTGRHRPSKRSHGSPKPEYRSLIYRDEL